MKEHAVYVLREDPDSAVFDWDLLDERVRADWREYDPLGVLPVALEFNEKAQAYEGKERGDGWRTLRADASMPISANECARELRARAEAQRKAEAQASDARAFGRNRGHQDATRALATTMIDGLVEAAEAYEDHGLARVLNDCKAQIDRLPYPPTPRL